MGNTEYDYIIIGSGFGGSVSAMRLSEKGYKVLVIEKGKRYQATDFPKTNWNLKKYLWVPFLKWFGFLKLTFYKRLFVLSGVGVGGGSLVYANTLMEPVDGFYDQIPIKSIAWKEALRPFFEEAKKMLGATPAKNNSIEDDLLKEIAKDMGRPDSYRSVDVAVYYNEDITPQDPYFGGKGPLRSPCTACAGCMVGCRYQAKNTLDKNYLWFAEKNGALILPEHQVIEIRKERDQYTIKATSIHNDSSTTTFLTKGVIVSGGVLGTLDLLFRQKYVLKTLPLLSDRLGLSILSNSESISGVIGTNEKVNHGVAISSLIQADKYTQVELCKFPDGSGSLFRLAFLAAGAGSPLKRRIQLFSSMFLKPIQFLKWIFQGQKASHGLVVLVMQSLKNSLTMRWTGKKMTLVNGENNDPIPVFIPAGHDVLTRLAEKTKGVAVNSMTETVFNMATTAHILGGCPMGVDSQSGVVNEYFQVHGYTNMYILDGSIIPANIGVNPSLTITALTEYAMDKIIPKK